MNVIFYRLNIDTYLKCNRLKFITYVKYNNNCKAYRTCRRSEPPLALPLSLSLSLTLGITICHLCLQRPPRLRISHGGNNVISKQHFSQKKKILLLLLLWFFPAFLLFIYKHFCGLPIEDVCVCETC